MFVSPLSCSMPIFILYLSPIRLPPLQWRPRDIDVVGCSWPQHPWALAHGFRCHDGRVIVGMLPWLGIFTFSDAT